MEEKKYGKCPECGAPCEATEKIATHNCDGDIMKVPYDEYNYTAKTGPAWVKANIVKVFEWAEKFHSENGDQLMLDDNEWYVTMEDEDEIGTRNCKSVTADDLAELYLMHHPDESAEQPGREVEFAEWLYKNRWFNFENGKWYYTFEQGTRVSDKTYQKNYVKTTAQLYQIFKEQKKA